MKTPEPKKKKKLLNKKNTLSMKQVKELREKFGIDQYKNQFFKNMKRKMKNNKSKLNLHGLALVRFLLHEHPTKKPFTLESTSFHYVSSSLSVIDTRLLFDLAYAFIPNFPYESRHLSEELSNQLIKMFHVVFPSKKHVMESPLGPENANCLFLDHDRFYSRKFEKKTLCKFEGNQFVRNNERVIPHLKVAIISNENGDITDDTIIYLGSHNMTKAAWGRFSNLGERVFVSNYEMGVILPPRPKSAYKKMNIVKKLGFVYPAKRFEPKERPFTRNKGNILK
jgi:tyrosyl-DNA phosphodiesterase-1